MICSFGRLGTWFGIDRWPIEPDMIAVAKGITGGTLPLGALLVRGEVAAPFFTGEPGAPVLRHGQTYAGHPACCAAALATMDILDGEGLIERGRELEQDLAGALAPLVDHPLVGEIRSGLGLMAAVDLAPGVLATMAGAVGALAGACREAGVLVRPLLRGIAVSPPLVISASEIGDLGTLIAEAWIASKPSCPERHAPAERPRRPPERSHPRRPARRHTLGSVVVGPGTS